MVSLPDRDIQRMGKTAAHPDQIEPVSRSHLLTGAGRTTLYCGTTEREEIKSAAQECILDAICVPHTPVLGLRSRGNAEDANSAAKLTGTSVIEFPGQVPLEESKPCAIFLYFSSQRTCASFNWTGNEYYLCFSFCIAPFFFHLQMVTFCIMLWYIRAWPLSKKPQ